jgi:polyisoprenyl-teichoic acid--peptidoglycan teichoic acid transferase
MKKRCWIALMALLLIIAIGGGIYFWRGHLIQQATTSVVAKPTNPIEIPKELQNEGERINVLLLGSDARENEAGRTDSMIIISADTKSKHVSIISIPRDTRVDLPGIGLTKITHANAVGEASGGVHSGTLASVQAASNLLGLTINDYAKINFIDLKKLLMQLEESM